MNFENELIDDFSSLNHSNFNILNAFSNSTYCDGKLFIAHQNIRSLRENFSVLVTHLDSFECIPDIFFISEIWIYGFEKNNYVLPGFNFHAKTNESYAAGGVGCFIKEEFTECEVSDVDFVSADVIKVSFKVDKEVYVFLCVYRLHAFSVSSFINEFSRLLEREKSKNLIIVGDFNLNILENNETVSMYRALLASNGLECFIDEPTRLVSGTCLDHMYGRFTNISHTYEQGVTDFMITDHAMTVLLVNRVKTKRVIHSPSTNNKTKTKINFEKLKTDLFYEFWEDVFIESDASRSYSIFIKKLKEHIANSYYTIRLKKSNIRLKPWISKQLLNKVKTKNKLKIKIKCSRNPSNSYLNNRYKRLCLELKKEIPVCRDNFYRTRLNSAKGNLKDEWQVVNNILNKSSFLKKPTVIRSGVNNCELTDNFDIAEAFNIYFTSIAGNSQTGFILSNCTTCSSHLNGFELTHTNSFAFEPITASEILKSIGSLKDSNACGVDGISNIVIKRIAFFLVDVLAHLFNNSIYSGVFPDELKCADVMPLFKKGAIDEMTNYRPISLLPSISKVFEKIVKERVVNYLKTINFFSSVQFGFQKGKSTEDALLEFCSRIFSNLDEKKYTCGLFIDITKAFDMVNHKILLRKLENAGFRSFMLEWFGSYLLNRSQRVKIDNIRSSIASFNIGVPQGSVLGPILFLVYINSLFSLDFKSTLTAFADDIGCTYGSKSALNLVADINWDLDLLRTWFNEHKLIISPKTKIMFFNLSSVNVFETDVMYHANDCQRFMINRCKSCTNEFSFYNNVSCSANCFVVEKVDSFKYLGLHIDSRMNFSCHTEYLRKYFNWTLRNFFYLSNVCSLKLLTTIYYGIFHSKLQYAISCWGGAYQNKIQPLLILQKAVIRKICRKHRRHPSFELFATLKILPVRHLYCFKVLKTFFRRSGNLNFRLISNYNLRGNFLNVVTVPDFRTTAFRNFCSVFSFRLFNKLPQSIRSITISGIFLKRIKQWLFNFDYLNIESLFTDILV